MSLPPRRPRPVSASRSSSPPPGSDSWARPWVQMKYFSFAPAVYPNMLAAVSEDAAAGELVTVYDRDGQVFGRGIYNPRAKVAVRVLQHGEDAFEEADLDERVARAIDLRLQRLGLPGRTDAFRAIHSDGDGLGGLVVDRYSETLSIEVSTLGMWRRLRRWLPVLHQKLGTQTHVIHADADIARMEGMRSADVPEMDDEAPRSVRIREDNVRYLVDFSDGHKTGFFCDQRENRLKFAQLARGSRVLDLCTYTGGFALSARLTGGCEDVTGVDLDEKAVAQAKKNADLNQVRVNWVHADAFTWGRQMIANGQMWDTVVVDPPKFVMSREGEFAQKGRNKYYDLNAVAIQMVKPGGLFVTCSCSGLLDVAEFEEIVMRAAHRNKRKLQIIDRTGAGPDHPVMSNAADGRYLKVVWALVW
ncbi:MAG: class I SAM-dependent rRNA methyltransferase [Verrucomicrobiaceae bacterium]|nr:class I SAM-dependent rRNA methyltransferase [Verrucomicrobiaceae bacterium]